MIAAANMTDSAIMTGAYSLTQNNNNNGKLCFSLYWIIMALMTFYGYILALG